MKTFNALLVNTLAASVATTFVWFAVTFWVYLETQSVIATSVMAGICITTVALSGFFLGSLVDRYKKKNVLVMSSLGTLVLFLLAGALYAATPPEAFTDAGSPALWAFIVLVLFGAIAGNLRGIALSTLVTIMIPEETRDKANGLVGTANGVAFLAASIMSGLAVGFLGMFWVMVTGILVTALVIVHVLTLAIPDAKAPPNAERPRVDIRRTITAIQAVPGLFGLIFFHTINNFLGGVFMSLMDAYGLQLVTVQVWGTLWGVLTLGFIVGGIWVARKGLGPNPLRTLFRANIIMWTICVFFTIQASVVLLAVGMFLYLCLIPMVEAAEQTILQKVVEPTRQGRVFGFAQSVEQAASPLTAFMIGPIAQFIFIPFMTTGAGVDLLGPWFGFGTGRGLALLFTITGVIGLVITLLAMRSRSFRVLSAHYVTDSQAAPQAVAPNY